MDRQLLEMGRALRQRILNLEREVRFLRRRRTGVIRRPVTARTGATYTPVPGDENTMVTLSNASAISIILPSDSTEAIPVYAEIDFLWLGAGQPSFSVGSGASFAVPPTPGPNLRAQGSGATAKKVASSSWIVYGDLSP